MTVLEPGQRVDRFRLDRTLRREPTVSAFVATDIGSEQPVTFTALTDRYVTDSGVRERFFDEVNAASRLEPHPHRTALLAWGQVGDSVYYVADYVDGLDLATLLARPDSVVSTDEAVAWLTQLASALDDAHRQGVVHRDVRPANVMVELSDEPRTVRLVDTGITKTTSSDRPGVTGVYVGTADYVSPEQIVGLGGVDGRADVYSLGCVAFELLGGRPPYGDVANDAARVAAHLQAPIPSLTALRPELSPDVDAVVAKSMAKRPDDRYRRCADFVAEFRRALNASGVAAASRRPAAHPERRNSTSEARRRRWRLALVLAVSALAVTGAVLAVREGEPGEGAAPDTASGPPDSTMANTTTTVLPTTSTDATTEPPPPPSTTAPTTVASTTPPTTLPPLNEFGLTVGAALTGALGPEAHFAVAVQERGDPRESAAPNSPAMLYLQWLRAASPSPASEPASATAHGFAVRADSPVELRDFVTVDGMVSTFSECRDATCVAIDTLVPPRPSADCDPGIECPHVRSESGRLMAYQRASLLLRWPAQILFYELVPTPADGPRAVAVDEPNGEVHYDATTGYMVATFADRPEPGTRHVLTVTLDDGTTDTITIYYGE